jgi:CRP/FNR family transcriptional regulator, cyclic AMP receptor protein
MSTFFPGVTAQQLASVPLFADLGDEALEAVRARSQFIGVHPGYKVVREGDAVHDLYVIESGTVDVVKDGEVVATLGVGDVFGEMAMLAGRHRNADVVAKDVVSLITLTTQDYRSLVSEVPQIDHRLRELSESRRS